MKKMKKMLCFVLTLTLVLGMSMPVQASAGTKQKLITAAKKAYNQYLSQSTIKWNEEGVYVKGSDLSFSVIDVNGDQIPELYVEAKVPASYGPVAFFDCYNGKIRCINHYGRTEFYGYYPSKKITVDLINVKGAYGLTYYITKRGKERTEIISKLRPYGGSVSFYVNGKEVSRAKYYQAIKKRIGNAEFVAAPKSRDLHANTQASRKKYLS